MLAAGSDTGHHPRHGRARYKRLREGQAPKPLGVVTPVIVAVEFIRSEMADAASLLPGARRSDKRIEVTADDMAAAYRVFRAMVGLASL